MSNFILQSTNEINIIILFPLLFCKAYNVQEKKEGADLSQKKKYWTLFLSTFQLSAFTFGGGFVIIDRKSIV